MNNLSFALIGWQFFAFAAAIFAALTAILGKIGVSDINSNLATFIRTIVILITSALLVSYRGQWLKLDSIPTKTLTFLILSGITTALSWLCYYRALQLGPASRVASVDKLSVALVVIFAAVFLSEPLTWKLIAGTVFIVCGVILIVI